MLLKVGLISLEESLGESLGESREETAPTGYLLFPCVWVWRTGTALTACAPGDQPLPTAAGRPARSPTPNRLHPPTDAPLPLDEQEVMVPWCPGTDSRRCQRCETLSLPPKPKPKPSALSCHSHSHHHSPALPPLRPPSSRSALNFPPPSPSPSRRHRQQHLDDEGKTMSTPTVAATSLPSHSHYNSSIHYSNSHYSSPHMLACHPTNPSLYSSNSHSSRPTYPAQPPAPAPAPAIPPANAPAPAPATAPRLPPPLPSPTAYSSSSSHSGLHGTSATSTRHSLQVQESTTLAPLISNHNNNIPSAAHAQPEHAMPTAPAPSGGKRKREGPNWDEFYKNGLPDEIIVIDDTPEPSPSSQALTAGHTHEVDTSASENGHAAKRQKRHNDREPAPYDPVYHSIATSHARTSGQLASPSKSTVSSDRTNSALHTTAATSLGSLSSSNGTYEYETQGPKRRRTTRQQAANDAKRLEELRRDAFQAYEPPPFPPKKAAEVPVKVITDVSAPLPPSALRFAKPC